MTTEWWLSRGAAGGSDLCLGVSLLGSLLSTTWDLAPCRAGLNARGRLRAPRHSSGAQRAGAPGQVLFVLNWTDVSWPLQHKLGCSKIHVRVKPQNVTVFGNKVFAAGMKVKIRMSSYWIGLGPKPWESSCKRQQQVHRHGEETVAWRRRQRLMPWASRSSKTLGGTLPQSPWRERGLADTLKLNFQPAELWGQKCAV